MEYPQYKSNLVDILIGDVFKPGVSDMFDAMEAKSKMKSETPISV